MKFRIDFNKPWYGAGKFTIVHAFRAVRGDMGNLGFFLRALWIVLVLALLITKPAAAHPGEPPALHDLGTAWNWDPLILAGVVLMSGLYARGMAALRRRQGRLRLIQKLRAVAFAVSQIAIIAALISPLEAMAGLYFSSHMVQHMLLTHIAAPLIALSFPISPFLMALPDAQRRRVGRWWASNPFGLRTAWRFLTQPAVPWLLYAITLWVWHMPFLYSAAVENEFIHFLEHLFFIIAAVLFWWTVVHYFARSISRRGIGVMYLFLFAVQNSLLGALLTFSTVPWYPVYIDRAQELGISAIADQNLAGLIMWIPDGVLNVIVAIILMKMWLEGMEQRQQSLERRSTGNIGSRPV
jgi:putative membrane protein